MSMSTLGAQLAALNSASQGGSALPTSRRQEDAVGRGLHHNAQVGHSVVDSTKSHIFKASILYPDARQASNVPLTTLKENCVAALEELESVDPAFGEYIAKLCSKSFERGLQTKEQNEQADSMIQDLLFRLALRMTSTSDSSLDTATCGLNIVEFLMRQYDLHLRPKLVSTMLLVWLPHHEHAYFLRWLQLVDLANLPSYAWLRPYAVPNAKVGRHAIAKAASKNLALCRDLLLLTTKAAVLPEAEATLSFTAAVWVEAMTLQQRDRGTVEGRTCQALLPTIRRACLTAPKNALFANWGYVMASTLVETSCLADDPRRVLITSILQGLSKPETTKDADNEMDVDGSEKRVNEGTIQNALIVVVSLLQQQPPVSIDSHQDDDGEESASKISCQLALGDEKRVLYGYRNGSCINDKAIWQALLGLDGLPRILSQLLVDDGFADMIHWIVSLWVAGWKRLQEARRKASKSKQKKYAVFVQGLLEDPKLNENVWSKPEMIEALVCFVLTNSSIDEKMGKDPEKQGSEKADAMLESTLQLFRRKNIAAYDRGIARALLRCRRQQRAYLAAFLGLVKTQGDPTTIGNPSEADVGFNLPPRVALEHADVEVRLEAIDRVVAQDEDDDPQLEGGETAVEALMRRVVLDDDIHVATKAAELVVQLLDGKKKKSKGVEQNLRDCSTSTFAGDALQALYKWTEHAQIEHKSRVVLLCHLLHLAAVAATRFEVPHEILIELIEAIGAFLVHVDTSIVKEASRGVILALTGKKGGRTSDKEAREVLMSHDNKMLRRFARPSYATANPSHQVFRRRFLPSMLKGYSETLSQRSNKTDIEKAKAAEEYCLWVISTHAESLPNDDRKLLLDVLKRTINEESVMPNHLSSILAIMTDSEESIYDDVCCHFIIDLCKAVRGSNGAIVPGLLVVLEMALRPSFRTEQAERLMVAAEKILSMEPKTCHFGLIHSLALLTHPEVSMRKRAIDFVSILGKHLSEHSTDKWKPFADICQCVSDNRSSAVLGGPALLATCMRASAKNSGNGSDFQSSLLKLVLCATFSYASEEPLDLPTMRSGSWLEFEAITGGHSASLAVLVALQEAGEAAFPLTTRWSKFGKPVLQFLLQTDFSGPISSASASLLDHVVAMLKGIKFVPTSEDGSSGNVIIMSGPASKGGRKRSYSFGKSGSTNLLQPYPKEMSDCMVSLLSSAKPNDFLRHVRNMIAQHILSSESWGRNVFLSFDGSERQRIISALLHTVGNDLATRADEAFFALPIPCRDIAQLIENLSMNEEGLAFSTYLADYASANSKNLVTDVDLVNVTVGLLDKFTELSSANAMEGESIEFARMSVLDALIELFEAAPDATKEKFTLNKKKKFKEWISALVGVVGTNEQSNYRPVESTRSKKSSLSVLTCLCSLYPTVVTEKLINAAISMVSATTSEKDASVVADCLGSIVPVYLDFSSAAKLSASDLIDAFVAVSNQQNGNSIRPILFQGFVNSIPTEERACAGDFLGAFLASSLAGEIYFSGIVGDGSTPPIQVSQIVSNVAVSRRIEAMLALVKYARDLVLTLAGDEVEDLNSVVSLNHLVAIAALGPEHKIPSSKQNDGLAKQAQKKLCTAFIVATCEMLTSPVLARFLRHCEADSSTSVVQLWQDLLLIQSVYNNKLGTAEVDDFGFWTSISETTTEALDFIQLHLQSHIFLAFATSLVRESDSEDLRARALQLVAERSLLLDASDPEAGLFLEMLPYLTSLLEDGEIVEKLLQQSAFIAIEHITRKICLNNNALGARHQDQLGKALMKSANFLDRFCRQDLAKMELGGLDNATIQVLCTSALCAATAVRACGARALTALPKLMKPSVLLLGKVNMALSENNIQSFEDQAQILQLPLLRLLSAVVDTIPQFLAPYIGDLFQQSVLASPALRRANDDQDTSIEKATEKLCKGIATKVPARQLLVPLSATLLKSDAPDTAMTLVEIITMSIHNAKSAEIAGKANSILKAGTFVFDLAGKHGHNAGLVDSAVKMFMAMVLKLSELQLRDLYSKVRAWRGEFVKAKPTEAAFRRYCFWLLSAELAFQLRSIFLPCVSSVFSDVVLELVSP